MWNSFIELLMHGIRLLADVFGSNTGLLILILSLLIRFALLPLSTRLASRTMERQRKLNKLQPELNQLKVKFKDKPERIPQETLAVYKKAQCFTGRQDGSSWRTDAGAYFRGNVYSH